jgi:hypothetical protein
MELVYMRNNRQPSEMRTEDLTELPILTKIGIAFIEKNIVKNFKFICCLPTLKLLGSTILHHHGQMEQLRC